MKQMVITFKNAMRVAKISMYGFFRMPIDIDRDVWHTWLSSLPAHTGSPERTRRNSPKERCVLRERGCFRWGRLESLRLFLKGLAEGTYKTKHAEAY